MVCEEEKVEELALQAQGGEKCWMSVFASVTVTHFLPTMAAGHLTHIFSMSVKGHKCLSNPQHCGTTRAALHRVMSDILRLPAAPGHPGANQSSGLKQGPRQTPLAEPSGITVYHLNQLDIWRESGDPVFICPASVVLCGV